MEIAKSSFHLSVFSLVFCNRRSAWHKQTFSKVLCNWCQNRSVAVRDKRIEFLCFSNSSSPQSCHSFPDATFPKESASAVRLWRRQRRRAYVRRRRNNRRHRWRGQRLVGKYTFQCRPVALPRCIPVAARSSSKNERKLGIMLLFAKFYLLENLPFLIWRPFGKKF